MVKAVEKSVIGTRTAIYDLVHPDTGRKIRFLGMIHAARPQYYAEIQSELDDCDVVFYEGVNGRIARWITLVYRIPTWFFNKTGLVGQNEHIDLSRKSDAVFKDFVVGLDPVVKSSRRKSGRLDSWKSPFRRLRGQRQAQCEALAMRARYDVSEQWPQTVWSAMQLVWPAQKAATRRLIHADISGEKFDAGWRKLDWKFRALILVLIPVLGFALAFSKRLRRWMFEGQCETQGSSEAWEGFEELANLVLHERDKVMIGKIEAFWEAEPDYRGQAAGVFGAAHLPAIINHLVEKRQFQITDSRWVMAVPAQ